VISNRDNYHVLSPAVFTLDDLARVEPKVLQVAIKDGCGLHQK
jgi:hypothetical protein